MNLLLDSVHYSCSLQPSTPHSFTHRNNNLFHLPARSFNFSRVNIIILDAFKPHPLYSLHERQRHTTHPNRIQRQQMHRITRDGETERVVAVDERSGVRSLQGAECQG